MLKQRILTALIALPILLYILFKGAPWILGIFIAVCVALCTYEIASIMLPKLEAVFGGVREGKVPQYLIWIYTAFGVALFGFSCLEGWSKPATAVIVINLIIFPAFFFSPTIDLAVGRFLGSLFCLAYGVLPWFAVWGIYRLGVDKLIFLLAVVWLGDTGGYFGGRYFGKHKMAKVISPKKTWEGAAAGLLASVAAGVVTSACFGGIAPVPTIIFISIIAGLFGQMGDLFESLCKRFSGVKDSGTIFPGHGGFLDRVDAVIFAAPIVWALFLGFS